MNATSPFRLALSLLSRQKGWFAAALVGRGIWELIPMQVPILAGAMVDGLTGKGISIYGVTWPEATPADVVQCVTLVLLGLAFAYGVSAWASTLAGAKLARKVVTELRKTLLEKITLLSIDHHQFYGSGALLDRALRDTGRMWSFTQRVFIRTLTNAVRAVYPIVMLVVIDPGLALLALSFAPLQWLGSWRLQRQLQTATHISMDSHADLTTMVKEHFDGIETIKTLNADHRAIAHLHGLMDRVEAHELSASTLSAYMRGAVWGVTSLGSALTWWQGGLRVIAGDMSLGTLVIFTGFVEFAYRPFRRFTDIAKTYRKGLASLEQIHSMLQTPSSVRVKPHAKPIRMTAGQITFQNVTFTYGQQTVLAQVNLDIQPRQLTAITGRSGAGKSSLLRLIPRLYDPDQGQILVDGQPLHQVTLASLRSQIAVVPQQPVIFSGTILENLQLAQPEAFRQEIERACAAAGALGFIEALDQGFRTRVGRAGQGLSGGQAQRLAIARALLRRPQILLLDEPTSALDAESEMVVVETPRQLRDEMTVVMVGHRLSTIRVADWIVLMEGGQVIAEGQHGALLARASRNEYVFTTDVIQSEGTDHVIPNR